MSITGNSGFHAIKHDLIESLEHQIDKAILSVRKEVYFVPVPVDRSLEFCNESPAGLAKAGTYLAAPARRVLSEKWRPDDWERSGILASFSITSEVGVLEREKSENKKVSLPPGEPQPEPVLTAVTGEKHFIALWKIRSESNVYHRFGKGAGGRDQWKPTPVGTSTVQLEGDEDTSADPYLDFFKTLVEAAEIQDESERKKELEKAVLAPTNTNAPDAKSKRKSSEKKIVRSVSSDLRRYTVNSSPPLARAMLKALNNGATETDMRGMLIQLAPKVVQEFQRITGRYVVGVSIHWDSNLPHLNLWHTGIEEVGFEHKGQKKSRYRRTAMNLNSSGGLLAWDRTERAFAWLGENLHDFSPVTVNELRNGEKRALKRQGRPAGDITLNRFFDAELEAALMERKLEKEIDEGFHEFVGNEKRRYSAGVGGRGTKNFRQLLERKAELENQVGALEDVKRELAEEKEQKDKLEKELKRVTEEQTMASDAFNEMDKKYSALEKAYAQLLERFNQLRDAAYKIIHYFLDKVSELPMPDSIKKSLEVINRYLAPETAPLEIKVPSKSAPEQTPKASSNEQELK